MSSKMLYTLMRLRKCYNFQWQKFFYRGTYNIYSENLFNLPQNKKFSTSVISDVEKSLPKTELRENPKEKQFRNFDDLFENLSSFYLKNAYINRELYIKVINSLNNVKLSTEQSNFILESINYIYTLSSEEKMDIFNKLWVYFINNNEINQDKILIALKTFQKNKITLNKAMIYLKEFKEFKSHLSTYEELIRLTCESGDIDKDTKEILEEMREKNFPLTDKVFNALIIGHSKNMNIKNCEAVLDTMNAANLTPSTETYCELIRAYIMNGLEQNAEKLIKEKSHNFSIEQTLTLLKCATSVNSQVLIKKLIEILPDEFKNNQVELPGYLRAICIELLYSNNIDESFLILENIPKPNIKDNEDSDKFGKFFIYEMIKSELYSDEKCIEICQKFIDKNINARALHLACETILKKYPQKSGEYLKTLSNVEQLRPHYFWPLLQYNYKKNGEFGIFETLKLMSTLLVPIDYETLSIYCFPRLSIIFKNIEDSVKHFEKSGLKTTTFLTPLISHLITLNKYDDAIKITNLYPTKLDTIQFIQPLINLAIKTKITKYFQQYTNLIKSLIKRSEKKDFDLGGQLLVELLSNNKYNKNLNRFHKLVNEFGIQNIKISKVSAEFLQSQLSKFEDNEENSKTLITLKEITDNELKLNSVEILDYQINHPRDMNLKELECHLIELEEKNMNTRGVLRRLLQLYVRHNELQKALHIKEKCDELNVHISPGMCASVLDLYIKLKNLDNAKRTLKDMKKKFPGFLVDEHKIIDLAALMVENNKIDQARNLIIERAEKDKVVGGEHIYRNIWNLLTQVAHYAAKMHANDDNNLTKDFFSMLRNYKYCTAQNVLLGPIIREYLIKNKIKEAVLEFKYIADNFKRTPLQLELMSILIKISNSEAPLNVNISQDEAKLYLQDIVSYSSEIHGSPSCNNSLLLAVAESGTEAQLRKLLINPEFRLNIEAMSKNIEHLNSNGRIENILKLARASRGIRHALNEQELYKMLLNEFVKKNDYGSGIELYNKLEADDDLKISAEFLNNLVNLLKFNNVDIPSNIALKAQLKI